MGISKITLNLLRKSPTLQLLCLGLFSILVIISRRIDTVSNAQFYAEDGTFWFQQAYNLGALKALLIPMSGYFQTLSRLGAIFAVLVPLKYAPLAMNFLAIFIQTLPILIFWHLAKEFKLKFSASILLIVSYLLLFNLQEIHISLTNAMWFLAVSAFMVVVSQRPTSRLSRIIFLLILTLSGLSGPFAILLSPIAVTWYYFNRSKWNLFKVSSLLGTGFIQFISIFSTPRSSQTFLGIDSLDGWFEVFSRQVVWGLLAGETNYFWLIDHLWQVNIFIKVISVLSLLLIVFTLYRANLRIKLLIGFGVVVFLSSLVFPTIQIPANKQPWQVLSEASGIRYWLIPMLAFLSSLIWGLSRRNPMLVQYFSRLLILFMVLFWLKQYRTYGGWKFDPRQDFNYQQQVQEFNQLESGEVFKLNHPPAGWFTKLEVKD